MIVAQEITHCRQPLVFWRPLPCSFGNVTDLWVVYLTLAARALPAHLLNCVNQTLKLLLSLPAVLLLLHLLCPCGIEPWFCSQNRAHVVGDIETVGQCTGHCEWCCIRIWTNSTTKFQQKPSWPWRRWHRPFNVDRLGSMAKCVLAPNQTLRKKPNITC